MIYGVAALGVATGLCVQVCGDVKSYIDRRASDIWSNITRSEPFKTPDGREVRDHGKKGNGGEYIAGKGWKPGQIDDIIKNPEDQYGSQQGDSRKGQTATVYVDKKGNFVVVNDKTGQVIAVNDRNNPRQKPPPKPPEPPEKPKS